MRRWIKILAIIAVLALVGTYAVYAVEYKGNYNLTVSVKLSISSERAVSLTEFTSSSSETEPLEFWNQLKSGGGSATTGYQVSWELNQSDDTTTLLTRTTILLGESQVISQSFDNIPAGQASLKITVRDAFGTYMHEMAFSLVVG